MAKIQVNKFNSNGAQQYIDEYGTFWIDLPNLGKYGPAPGVNGDPPSSVKFGASDTTAPVITASQSFSYQENKTAGYTVGTVLATDNVGVTGFKFADSGTSTSNDGYYAISTSGVITLTNAGVAAGVAQNDYEITPNSFNYGIQARDAAGNWSASTNVTFNVTDDTSDNVSSIAVSTTPLTTLLAFNYRGLISGVSLTSNTAGIIKLGSTEINTQAIVGSVTLGGTGGVQTTAAQGIFTVTSGINVGTDTTGNTYALGTSGADTLTGQHVWGYGGYNAITGTAGSDWLVGGNDGNRISGGKMADNMYGGSGYDTFVISAANGDSGNIEGGIGYGTTDCVFYFTTGSDKLALDIAGTSSNFIASNAGSGSGVGNERGSFDLAKSLLQNDGSIKYVLAYNVTNSGNSWLYYFPNGTATTYGAGDYTVIELIGINSSSQFAYSDIVSIASLSSTYITSLSWDNDLSFFSDNTQFGDILRLDISFSDGTFNNTVSPKPGDTSFTLYVNGTAIPLSYLDTASPGNFSYGLTPYDDPSKPGLVGCMEMYLVNTALISSGNSIKLVGSYGGATVESPLITIA